MSVRRLKTGVAERIHSLHSILDVADAVMCLVENSVLHGGATSIEVHVSRDLDLVVHDNGCGLTLTQLAACGARATDDRVADDDNNAWTHRHSLANLAALSRY